MGIEVKVPVLPESVADATIATWHKKPGDVVRRDENLVDLETDKVVLEVPAPADGVLGDLSQEAGALVAAGDLLAVIDDTADIGEASSEEKATDESDQPASTEVEAKSAAESSQADNAELAPAVRRLVSENNLDPATIPATGRDGRLTKEDVVNFMEKGDSSKKAAPDSAKATASAPSAPAGARPSERVAMSRLRGRIAERMVEAQSTAAMLTSFNEVNLQAVMDLRKKYKEEFIERHGVKLGFMSFFVKACCEALKKYPVVNASVEGNDVIYHGYADVGIAVSTERGLMVPVVRNAETMNLAQIEQSIGDYAGQARDGSIKLEDLQGGTFTVTNGGVFGSLISTPILNMPQSAILGMHTIKERPIVENGEIVARPMMYIALTYDHRIVDGRDAVLFLVAVKDALEDPNRLLLDI